MYERPDVPKDSPHRNLIADIVLVVVVVAIGVLVTMLWDLANANSVDRKSTRLNSSHP